MKYKDLKPVLADQVLEVVLTKDSLPTAHYKVNRGSNDKKLLAAIFEKDPISKLDDFDVIAVYNTEHGFTLEFEFTPELAKICSGLGELFLRV